MLPPNTVLQGRYQIVRMLGKGGMGAVYVATDQRFGSTVALKQMLVSGDALQRAFEREARLLNTLQHAALPHVIDHFAEGDGRFLVMQFIPGEDLGHMLRERHTPFAVTEVLGWADQLLDLLDYLHTHEPPIVHRDIKPENLKITNRGNVILLDFGLAKGLAELTTHTQPGAGSIIGYTPHYASLEQIRGTGTEPRSDLYSLGATMYHLLTGDLPPDAVQRADSFVNGHPDPLHSAHTVNPAVPASVASVINSAMGLKRDDRPATASAMRAALKLAASGVGAPSDTIVTSGREAGAGAATTIPAARQTARQYPAPGTVPDPHNGVPTPIPGTVPVQPVPASGSGLKIATAAGILFGLLLLTAIGVIGYIMWPKPPAPPPPVVNASPIALTPTPVPLPRDSGGTPAKPAQPSTVTITANASTTRNAMGSNRYDPNLAIDGDLATAWVEGSGGAGIGDSLTLQIAPSARVAKLVIAPGYFKTQAAWEKNNRLRRVTIETSDGRTFDASFADAFRAQEVAIGGAAVSWIRITIDDAYLGGDGLDTAIGEIEVVTE